MSKVEFTKVDKDFKVVKSTDDRYLLLSLFIGRFRFLDDIQEVISDLENVKNGVKTWEEIFAPLGNNWDIAYGNGSLDVENYTAYFLAGDETNQSFKMPLEELINLKIGRYL